MFVAMALDSILMMNYVQVFLKKRDWNSSRYRQNCNGPSDHMLLVVFRDYVPNSYAYTARAIRLRSASVSRAKMELVTAAN
jgi:hypothetical protein